MIQEMCSRQSSPSSCLSGRHSCWFHRSHGEGVLSKWLRPSERRKYTLDFDSRILYYTTADGTRNVSLPTSFSDILGASLVSEEAPKKSASGFRRSPSKGFLVSTSAATDRSPLPLTTFELVMRKKRVRLASEKESDATLWVEMLTTACRIGQGLDLRSSAAKDSGSHLSPEFQFPPRLVVQEDSCDPPPGPEGAAAEPEGQQPSSVKSCSQVSQHSTTLAETCSDGGRSVWSEVDSVDGAGRATGDCETEAADGLEQVAPAEVCPSGMALDDQPRRLLAVDLGFEEVDVLGDEPGESPVSTPRCPAAAAFEDILQEKRSPAPDAASEGNDREGDENARAARARADLMLAYRPAQAVSSGGHRGARRADKGADGSGRKVQLTPLEAKPQDAKRRVKKLAAELGCGDAENAARIAADLMLVERLKGAVPKPRPRTPQP